MQAKLAAGAKQDAAFINDGRPLAPEVDEKGEKIADWKRKVMQKKLDAQWVRVC